MINYKHIYLFISIHLAPVQDIILSRDNCTETCAPATPPNLDFIEKEPSLLQCIATGGSPPPDIKIYIEDYDITDRFKTATYTQLVGEYGLRIMHSSVHTHTNSFVLNAGDDGKLLRCTAAVPSWSENVTMTIAHVMCKY